MWDDALALDEFPKSIASTVALVRQSLAMKRNFVGSLCAALAGGLLSASTAFASVAVGTDVGYLNVASTPSAEVFIDEVDTGKTTPVTQLALKPGAHKLTLVSADKTVKRSLGFTITGGETTRLTINL